MPPKERLSGSFRDPSGFLFWEDGRLYRQINQCYRQDYELLLTSGLFEELVQAHLLIPHREVDVTAVEPAIGYKVIQPQLIDFVSYPYEWSFSQLRDAALTTLEIQKRALDRGMWLKDASAYNIQFQGSHPILIDTLSFDQYRQGEPWAAYQQFCQHFLAPLALMAYTDVRLSQLLRVYIDGIPLDLARQLLPWRTRLSFGLLNHIHLHASAQKRYARQAIDHRQAKRKMSLTALRGWIDSLYTTVQKLRWRSIDTAWADYYEDTNYDTRASTHKKTLVASYLESVQPQAVWDMGANTGRYSRVASSKGIFTIAFDVDPGAVEYNYRQASQAGETKLLPLVLDATNPSPGLGWDNQERNSIFERGRPDCTLALALIHHLAIANNVPLPHLAEFFRSFSHWLIIEFVPKSDSQVKRLLATRQDIFPDYTQAGFESAFQKSFQIYDREDIEDSERVLYLMQAL